MPKRVGVVTVSRSDYGHLCPVLSEIRGAPDLELALFVSGSHLAPRFGETVRLIEADGWPVAERVDTLLDSDAPLAIAGSVGRGVTAFAEAFERQRPDVVVVLGDRFEMLSAAAAALPLTLPVAHLHGGEITEGAIDEQIRHAITKLAHLHFAAAEPYARRIAQMGEEAWRIHCVGAPGLDRFRTMTFLPRRALGERLGLPLARPVLLVTFHPAALEFGDPAAQTNELLAALSRFDVEIVLTSPGADASSHRIIERLRAFAADHGNARFLASLGEDVYCSLLREAGTMVGNSSSALIEAPSFRLPAVNVGDRQRGRLRAANVVDVGHGRDEIAAGIEKALDPAFRRSLDGLRNPYGDGHAAPRIVKVLREVELGPRLVRKAFADQ